MSLTVRVVAPTGRDADLIVRVLNQHSIASEAFADARTPLEAASHEPLGPLLIAEESLTPPVVELLASIVHSQPPWSDFPILILTTVRSNSRRVERLESQHRQLGSPVLLERPIRTETLVSTLRAAVRARMRQYEVRDALLARDKALEELRSERDTLQASEERFRRLIENASVGINISDMTGGITFCNSTLLQLIGYTAEDVQAGRVRWDELTPAEFAEADRKANQQLLETGTCAPYQKAYRARDGRLIPLLVGMTMLSAHPAEPTKQQVATFLTDLTSQKQAEAALVQSEKLAAVGRLAASISHEINNPLEAVTNLLYIAKLEDGLPDSARDFLSLAELELSRVSQIATQTLRFHRQSTAPREVEADDLIQSVLRLYQGRLQNSLIRLDYEPSDAGPITCYEGDVRQVLNNLVGNAIDAMRNGGRLVLRAAASTLWSTGQRGVTITVADTGEGMTADVRRHIFDAFYSTKGTNGTGLGLWISKGIVEKHRGRLQVRSSQRQGASGTVFRLFLPCKFVADDK